jgi:hypothetical protein
MATPVALVELQDNVADCPFCIVEGEADRVTVGVGGGGGGGGGGSTLGGGGGGGATFFAQPVPPINMATKTTVNTAKVTRDFLMNWASFESQSCFYFTVFKLIKVPLYSNGTAKIALPV